VTVRRRQVEPFTKDEVTRLLAVCSRDRLGALYTVAMAVGLRPGEALGLRWVDVELDARRPFLRVRRSLKKGLGGKPVLGEPKTVCSPLYRDGRNGYNPPSPSPDPGGQMDDLVLTIIRDLISGYANSRGCDPEDHVVQSLVEDACTCYLNGTPVSIVCETAGQQLRHPSADLVRR
jgi:integrase